MSARTPAPRAPARRLVRTMAARAARGVVLAWLACWAAAAAGAPIREIKVVSRVTPLADTAFVLSEVGLRVGDEADARHISRDVRALMNSGRFAFVDSELTPVESGYLLTFVVEVKLKLERPVDLAGHEAISARKIRHWLELEIGDPIDDGILAVKTRKVAEEYHKKFYPDVKLRWAIEPRTNGFARVSIQIEEGRRASLRRVRFEGNTYRPPSRWTRFKAGLFRRQPETVSVAPTTLREALKPRLWHLFSFLTKRGQYDPDELNADRDLLTALYQHNGYLDVRIDEHAAREYKRKKLEAVFLVVEGRQYRLGALALSGAQRFPESTLWGLVKLKTGDIAAMDAIDRTAAALQEYYQSRGYMRTTVKPLLTPRTDAPVVDVLFDIAEGGLIHLRYIDIRGNARTKDQVIRRELTLYPGEVYDVTRIRQGERLLENLGFFSRVSSTPRETLDPARDDLLYEVEEKSTGQFMVGAGYSSVDEVFAFMELSQGNFDLFNWPHFTGDGQKLRLRAQVGSASENYELSFVEPWFLDRKLSLGFDLYDIARNNLSSEYDEQRIGGAVTLGKPIKGFFRRAELKYSLEDITIYDVSTNAIQRIQDEKGSRLVSTLKLTLTHDTRDNVFFPGRGNKTTVSGRLSGGPLGADTDVYGFESETVSYFPIWFDHTISLRGWAEVIEEYGRDDDVHIFDRLFLGGARTLRGFKYRRVAPYEEDVPIGGKTAALATAEYIVPITKKVVRLAGFYDLGNVWLDAYDFDLLEYCSDIGLGVRLNIPSFPIRIDYAWPLEISGDVSRTSARFNLWLGYTY